MPLRPSSRAKRAFAKASPPNNNGLGLGPGRFTEERVGTGITFFGFDYAFLKYDYEWQSEKQGQSESIGDAIPRKPSIMATACNELHICKPPGVGASLNQD